MFLGKKYRIVVAALIFSATILLFVLKLIWIILVFSLACFLLILSVYFKNRIISFFLVVLSVPILAITTRIFIIEIYIVPSSSMENTIYSGDILLVNRLAYGPA